MSGLPGRIAPCVKPTENSTPRASPSAMAGAGDGFTAVSAAVTGYFADKMNVAAAGLTVDTVTGFLGRRGVDGEISAAAKSVLGECDAARFASGAASGAEGEELAGRAGDVIRSLEKEHLR